MITVTSGEVQKKFGAFRAKAHAEPVIVTSHGRPDLVIMSHAEFLSLRKRARNTVQAADLSETDRALIEAAEAPTQSHAFDHEDAG
jgi:prevent-host-death family protein